MERLVSATEWARRLRAREVSAVEVFHWHWGLVEARNSELNALVTLTPELALAQARAADQGDGPRGLLCGLPVGHKDLEETMGVRTTFGSPVFADYVPSFDTEIVRRMKAAGCVCLGKTNTPEFGAGSQTFNPVFGKTRNPYDLSKTCGGSSGGAAVGLATGMIALADGSDTGGSLRNPASFCGVTGLRTTPGLVPVEPTRAVGSPLTVKGPMARDCEDLGLLLAVLAGLGEVPELGREFRGTRVAWLGEIPGMPFEREVREVVDRARVRFLDAGCVVDEAVPDFADADAAFRVLRAREFFQKLGDVDTTRVKETVRLEIERGAALTDEAVQQAYALRAGLQARMAAFQATYEFFVLPTVQVLPFDIDQPYVTSINGLELPTYIDWMRSCYFISILGVPALSVPCGFSSGGLPVGLQIVGRAGADWDVVRLGKVIMS